MKFLCVGCDAQMMSVESESPGDGTLAITFRCPSCEREVAMLTNPMETQMVSSLCVEVGERSVSPTPFQSIRTHLETADESAIVDRREAVRPAWSDEAEARLARVPGFVRGMVRELYCEWARERGVGLVTPEIMDEARSDLGVEGL